MFWRWSSVSAAVSCGLILGCGDSKRVQSVDAGVLYAEATTQFAPIRPGMWVDLNTADPHDLEAKTSWWPIGGAATFRTTPNGVDLALLLRGCRVPYLYPVRIYAGSDCSALKFGSEPWDGARGTLKDSLLCIGSAGGSLYESRLTDEPQPWTLGGSASSDLIGRTLAVLDPDTGEPLVCGRIEVGKAGKPAASNDPGRPRHDTVTALANLCGFRAGPPPAGSAHCSDVEELADCAFEHCVAACLDVCAEYAACLDAASNTCAGECQAPDECQACLGSASCSLAFCSKVVLCTSAPTPGGPCTELRECCKRQGPLVEACMSFVDVVEALSGDPSCIGTLNDWDFNTNVAYRSPCYPDGGVPSE